MLVCRGRPLWRPADRYSTTSIVPPDSRNHSLSAGSWPIMRYSESDDEDDEQVEDWKEMVSGPDADMRRVSRRAKSLAGEGLSAVMQGGWVVVEAIVSEEKGGSECP